MTDEREQQFRDKYKKTLVIKPSPVDDRNFKVRNFISIELPEETNNYVNELPVKDQGDLPICAGCAGAEDQENKDVVDVELGEWLSPMYLYNSRENPSQDGMDNLDLFKIRQKKGTCRESLYPMGSTGEPSTEAVVDALNHRIGAYAQATTLDEVKATCAVGSGGVIAVAVYNFTERMWYQRPGDVLEGYHDMHYVDYKNSTRKFLIKNSWGTSFGQNGYIFMDYDDFDLALEFWAGVDLPSPPNPNPGPTPGPGPTPTPPPPPPAPKKKLPPWAISLLILTGFAILVTALYFILR